MNCPIVLQSEDCASAWANAVLALKSNSWDAWNMVITITKPCKEDPIAFSRLTAFAEEHGLITPKHVRHTIFPYQWYKGPAAKERMYKHYNYFYKRSRKMKHHGWGTYFKRMISYRTKDGEEFDQLENIIIHIRKRKNTYKASDIMIIPEVGSELNKLRGAPCLNYVAVQAEKTETSKRINLLAVYRNHDFRERAYGNYLGLCSLLSYICQETNSDVGYVTCVSSHAFVPNNKGELYNIARDILGESNNE